MNYLKYWKLDRAPFSNYGSTTSESTSTFFDQGSVEEAIARIHFLIQSQRRLGVIVGPSGVGKTRLLKQFIHSPISVTRIAPECQIHYIGVDGWSCEQLYRWIATTVGQVPFVRKNDLKQTACDSLIGATAIQKTVTLILDDFDCGSKDLYRGISELNNLSSQLTILLAVSSLPASNAFDTTMSSTKFTWHSIMNRCQMRIDLPAWGLGQTAEYFSWMLESAGGRPGIFEAQAITRIHEISNGLVEKINQIADLSLVAAAARKFVRVQSELIDQVCEELGIVSNSPMLEWPESSRVGELGPLHTMNF